MNQFQNCLRKSTICSALRPKQMFQLKINQSFTAVCYKWFGCTTLLEFILRRTALLINLSNSFKWPIFRPGWCLTSLDPGFQIKSSLRHCLSLNCTDGETRNIHISNRNWCEHQIKVVSSSTHAREQVTFITYRIAATLDSYIISISRFLFFSTDTCYSQFEQLDAICFNHNTLFYSYLALISFADQIQPSENDNFCPNIQSR